MAEEEITDNWEALEDSGELDKRLPQAKITVKKNPESYSVPTLQEDGTRTAFKPQFRILKRTPNAAADSEDAKQKQIPPKPVRTLEEREAAYAEARLRILGSASSPEENNHDTNANTNSTEQTKTNSLSTQLDQVKLTDNIVRLPEGPMFDGNVGFQGGRGIRR